MAAYKSTDGIVDMTHSTFEILWNSILNTTTEAVKDITYKNVEYWGYSQAVPGGTTDLSEVRFAIFFMLPENRT